MSKIITADFSSGKDRVTARGLWQFDRGVKLKVIGINVADVNRVDFASVIASDSVPVVVVPDGDGTFTVSIPGAVTKSSYGVTAYIYVDTADYGYTVKAVNMPVTLRQEAWKPGEEEKPDPFGEVVEKVSGYAKNARYFANAAAESEKAASESATTATQQATTAAQSATNASGSAESASQSAEAATTAAGNAAESATSASQSAETAGQKATAAETSASNAAESATAAEKSATAAGDSASAAKTSETAATASAVTATEQAEKIKASAEQIEKNKTDVASLKGDITNNNLLSLGNLIQNSYVDNGIIKEYSGWSRTDFINVSQFTKIRVLTNGRDSIFNAFYTKDKKFMGNFTINIGENEITLNGAYYIIMSSETKHLKNYELSAVETKDAHNISKLKGDLDNVLVSNVDAKFTIDGNYVDKNNGELVTDSTYEATDFIEIPALATGLKFDVTFKSPRSREYNAFYDENKKFITNFSYGNQITGIHEAHIPENAKYFRLSKHKTEVIINKTTTVYDRKIADTVSELSDTVSELSDNVSKLEEKLPPYLNDEFDSTLNTVSEIIQNKNNLTVIGVMTDLHFSSSGSGFSENELRTGVFNAVKALAKMTTKIPFDVVAFLGDYIQLPDKDNGQTKEMGISNLMDVNQMMLKMNAPTMAISGNHEGNYTGDGTGYGLTDAEIYNYLLKKSILTNKAVRHNNDYYVDDTASLTRHVFIDGCAITENESTKNWLKNVVSSNLPDGYSIIVYSHYSMNSTSVLTYVKYYIDAIIQGGHTPILWIGGHWHADRHDTYNGCLVVSLLQSGLWSSEPSEDGMTYKHKVGTATESAFTVFIVDRDNKKVNLIRFGLGNDYEYTLG